MKRILSGTIVLFACAVTYAQSNRSNPPVQASNATYRLFPTQNIWTFIKLNTRNGMMWQVQFDVKGDNRFQEILNPQPQNAVVDEVNDRYTLYPTQNTYNFILLDQTDGRTWQVQWSLDPKNKGMVQIK
jgi:hypothetical protein